MSDLAGLTLPIYDIEVFDNSILSTFQRCPRKGFYQYGLRRAPLGINYPIQFGVAYHKFQEVIENLYKKLIVDGDKKLEDPKTQRLIYELAFSKATEVTRVFQGGVAELSWVDPPIGHDKEYLTKARLDATCEEAFDAWIEEKREGIIEVILSEQGFDLIISENWPVGPMRYGGRFDQLISWNRKLWLRDFKTTTRMGKTYGQKFDPDNQMSGYVWAGGLLSGQPIEGASIETVYNTKTKGPEFHNHLSTRTDWQIANWKEEAIDEISTVRDHFVKRTFPKRTDSCNDYGGCFFRDACRRDGWGNIQRWLEANTVESFWDFTDPEGEEGTVD